MRLAQTLILYFAALLGLVPQLAAQTPLVSKSGKYIVYAGTYTRDNLSKGIYSMQFDAKTGKAGEPQLAAETPNPSFLALHWNRKYLYSVSELSSFGGQTTGAVSAFAIDPSSGKLKLLNTVASRGTSPCHLAVDKTGKTLVVVNYGDGVTSAFAIRDDGSLSEATSVMQHKGSSVNPKRQAGPHAHSVNLSADNRFAVVADLGLDQLLVYKLDGAGSRLEANNPAYVRLHPGGGPRHFAFHPNGKIAYANHEMGNYVSALTWDAQRGAFNVIEALPTLPSDFDAVSHTAHVEVHPSGKFVYVSNRGHNSLAGYSVDQATGRLTRIGITSTQGEIPRNFGIEPGGNYLIAANQNTDNVVVFKLDARTGALTPTGQNLKVGRPVCIKYFPVD
jgi:6-phosphogluconolactonase